MIVYERHAIISGDEDGAHTEKSRDAVMLLHIYAKQIWSEVTSRQWYKRKRVVGGRQANIWSKLRGMSASYASHLHPTL